MKKFILLITLSFAFALAPLAAATPEKILYPKPDAAQIRQFERTDYGAAAAETKPVNDLVFAMYHYNDDEAFCIEMEKFLLDELASKRGTSRYRTLLAQMVQAVGVQKQGKRLAKLRDAEKDEAVRSRLAEAAAHGKRSGPTPKAEKEFSVPKQLPSAPRDQARLIDYLSVHDGIPLPAYLTLENLDDALKPRLVYAFLARGETASRFVPLKAETPALALALGSAYARHGESAHTLARLLSYAPLLDKAQTAQMAVHIAQAPGADRADKLAATLGSSNAAESALAAAALAQMDLSQFGRGFLAGYDAASAAEKRAMLKVCESLADEYVFGEIARRLPVETDAGLRTAMQRALMRISQAVFTPAMFGAVEAAYAQTPQDAAPAAKVFWLRFAPLHDDDGAIAFCKKAHADGFRSDAIKTLGAWKTPRAQKPLEDYAKSAADERERKLAQEALASLKERVKKKK